MREQAKDAQEGKQIVQRGYSSTNGHQMYGNGGAAAQLRGKWSGGAQQGDRESRLLQGKQLGAKDEQGLIAGDTEEDGDFGCRGGHGVILTALRIEKGGGWTYSCWRVSCE